MAGTQHSTAQHSTAQASVCCSVVYMEYGLCGLQWTAGAPKSEMPVVVDRRFSYCTVYRADL
eukprot:COSAG02_NODE_2778_length_8051_cov_829.131162_10_plen_61_part_01